jgi:hypothetical protein
MQAWQQVKVINPDSEYNGRAGRVVRVETKGDAHNVYVELDATADLGADVASFAASELVVL